MKRFLRTAAMMVMAAALLGGCAGNTGSTENADNGVNEEALEAEGATVDSEKAEGVEGEADVSLSVTVEPLSEEEFAQIEPGNAEDPVIENFSKVTVTVDMTGMTPGTERSVKMPALRNLMADSGVGKYIQGSGYSQNDTEADFSKFVSENIIYRGGLTDDDIRGIFAGAEAVAEYTGADGTPVEATIPFTDNIEFK